MNKRIDIIVYNSNAGHTKEFARILGEKTGIRVIELKEAMKVIPADTPVIFMGWLMAGQVKGYKKASKRFDVMALCGVGMAPQGQQLEDINKNNKIPEDTKIFALQGGFEIEKLHGIYKLMMNMMKKTAGKGLQDKQDRTPDEDAMLDLMMNGKDLVSEDKLQEVIEWINE